MVGQEQYSWGEVQSNVCFKESSGCCVGNGLKGNRSESRETNQEVMMVILPRMAAVGTSVKEFSLHILQLRKLRSREGE